MDRLPVDLPDGAQDRSNWRAYTKFAATHDVQRREADKEDRERQSERDCDGPIKYHVYSFEIALRKVLRKHEEPHVFWNDLQMWSSTCFHVTSHFACDNRG